MVDEVGAAVVVVVVVAAVVGTSGSEPAVPAAGVRSTDTATVERGPLATMVSGTGILTHRAGPDGSPFTAINRATGTYTRLPAVGDEVACGGVLYRVDEEPVLLLCGAVPAYRDLGPGDTGEDVRALKQDLHDLGHDTGPVDGSFTAQTAAALARLQAERGAEATGALGVDDAVFLPGPVRIAEVVAELGASAEPGGQVLRATSTVLEVQVELDVAQQAAVHPGDVVRITLPGGTSLPGAVDRVGTIVTPPSGPDAAGGTAVGAFIGVDEPGAARGVDDIPVQVEITTTGVDDALSVPVTALLGSPGGGFAVEVVRDGGRRELVVVDLGLFNTAGGRVQVDGAVWAGDRVVVPSA